MARRADHDRQQLAEMILCAAGDIVAAKGLSALSARTVAAKIGYSAGTIYNIFENMDALILQVNALTLDALEAACQSAAAADLGDPIQSMVRVGEAYLSFVEQRPNLWRALFEHRMFADQEAPEWYRERIERLFEILEGVLGPLFAPGDAEARRNAARVLWCGVHGIQAVAASGKLGVISSATVADMARDLIRGYLAGVPGRV